MSINNYVKFDDKFNNLTEAYLKIPAKRLMYPRGLNLSEEFIGAFNMECKRLVESGQKPVKLCERVNKALMIHFNNLTEELDTIVNREPEVVGVLEKDKKKPAYGKDSQHQDDMERWSTEEDEKEVEEEKSKKPGG